MSRRVVVTGLGALTPVGNDVKSTFAALAGGKSGIARITLFDPSNLSVQIAGEVKDFDPTKYIDAREARRMDRSTQLAVAAANEAIADSGLKIDANNTEQVGVFIGSSIAGIRTILDQQKVLEERGPGRVSPFGLLMMSADIPGAQIALIHGIKGPNLAIVSACATGGHTIGEAAETIKRGDADVMVAGGTDAAILPLVLAGFSVMKALATDNDSPEKAMRPFDATRTGFVVSEGAAVLVLEELEHALARGAKVYAELAGYGSTNDAYHMIAPSENGEGAARTMRMALRKAGMQPHEVDYINAHGSSTPLNDKVETAAVKNVFGQHAYKLAVSSTKSMVGHMMGTAGAIEAMACVMAIHDGILPPTINLDHSDPDCDLDYVPNVARRAETKVAMSNSFGLGGHNSCLILRRFSERD